MNTATTQTGGGLAAAGSGRGRSRRRALTPDELGAAAVMAAVAAGLTIFGTIVPVAASVVALAVVPFGIVAQRQGVRATVATLVAAGCLTGLIAGLGAALGVVICALLGGFVGDFKRRGWTVGAVWLAAAIVAPLAAVIVDLVLLAFASYRKLVLASIQSTVRGLARFLRHAAPLQPAADWLDHATANVLAHWALVAAGVVIVVVVVSLLLSWLLIGQVLTRLQWVGNDRLSLPPADAGDEVSVPAPVPVHLHDVSVRYGATLALDLDLRIPLGQFIVVVGDNGSGKSTLARLLAGSRPTTGTIERDGTVGLGQPGGTALIMQRPDSQVIGLRVRDDVLWGLPADHAVDVEQLLELVGLADLADHDTATLSGGQLQRLAVAAALARQPRLLISDESTAMIDPSGRAELVALYERLPRRFPMTVVHITHHLEVAAAADRVIRLHHGRVVADVTGGGADAERSVLPAAPPPALPHAVAGGPGAEQPHGQDLVLDGVGYEYGHGTVWERRALSGLNLTITAGEGVLVVGANGSGKSTLAWLVAGLLRPTYGSCRLAGADTHRRNGAVSIAFQHARLQLQRSTVGDDIADAAGWGAVEHGELGPAELLQQAERHRHIADALRAVGLGPELASRSVEQLSGGQQRRVAIAGLLARRPSVLVLDEPLAGLDAPAVQGLVELLARLRATSGLTLIVVTHDPEPLARVCPRMIRLDRGTVVHDGDADGSVSALDWSVA